MPLWPNRQVRRMQYTAEGITTTGEYWRRMTGIPATLADLTWPTALQLVFCPVFSPIAQSGGVRWVNGAAVGGLIRGGIYLPDSEGKPGALFWKSDPTPQSQANFLPAPSFNWNYRAGLMYIAFTCANNTSKFISVANITTDGKNILAGVFTQQLTSLDLPAVATPVATPTACILPWFRI